MKAGAKYYQAGALVVTRFCTIENATQWRKASAGSLIDLHLEGSLEVETSGRRVLASSFIFLLEPLQALSSFPCFV